MQNRPKAANGELKQEVRMQTFAPAVSQRRSHGKGIRVGSPCLYQWTLLESLLDFLHQEYTNEQRVNDLIIMG